MNDFHLSDDEEKNSSKLSFLKSKKPNSENLMKEEPVFSTKKDEETAPDVSEDMVVRPSSESQNEDQEIGKETTEMKPKPRILPVKSTSSGNLLDHYNCIS